MEVKVSLTQGFALGYDIPALRALSGWTLLPSRSGLAGSLREAYQKTRNYRLAMQHGRAAWFRLFGELSKRQGEAREKGRRK
jgi:hypothetical protein